MSLRRAARRDSNESGIVKALRDCGYLVKHLNEWDLVVCRRGAKTIYMLEVKTADGELKPSQEKMIADGWPLIIVRTPEEALEAVRL